ncbi:hypothetical protein [Palleronia sp.]|uniref:hypothetical protein n=1 Tax=Palleronia sp. TaxID=1940284 RepID=UPI0035C7EB17
MGLAGDLDGEGDASGAATLSFADRSGGRIAAFEMSHHRFDEGGFDPLAVLSAPQSATRSRLEFGRTVGGPIDWVISWEAFQEDSPPGDASGQMLAAELGVSPGPARRATLRLAHDRRSFYGADATYEELGLAFQARRRGGRDEALVSARTTPEGVRLETGVGMVREMPCGGAMGVQVGLAKTADGDVLPIGDLDLRLGLTRQSRLVLDAGHQVIDDPSRGEISDLRLDLSVYHRSTRLTSIEFGLGTFHREPISGADADAGMRASARLSRDLTPDWSLAAELEHRRLDPGRSQETRRSELSIMLERRFGGQGF